MIVVFSKNLSQSSKWIFSPISIGDFFWFDMFIHSSSSRTFDASFTKTYVVFVSLSIRHKIMFDKTFHNWTCRYFFITQQFFKIGKFRTCHPRFSTELQEVWAQREPLHLYLHSSSHPYIEVWFWWLPFYSKK